MRGMDFIIKSPADLIEAINKYGFLPYFRNSIEGFSIEEHIEPRYWFGDEEGAWEWKGLVIQKTGCAYGKFFERKAVYISKEWFPDFANYCRDGYDFDALYGDTPVYEVDDVEVTESEYKNAHKPYDSISISEGIGRAQSFEDLYCKVGDIYYDYYFTYYEAYSVVYDSTATEISIRNTVNGLPVKRIGSYLLSGTSVKTLNIPANIESFYYYGLNGEALTAINVDSANPYYASKEGVIYNKDMTELVKFPTARDASNYTFPQSVTEVGRYAFAWCTGTKNIVIPETIDTINEGAFYSCPNLSSITIMNPECSIYDYWNDGDGITICNTYDDTTEKGNYLGVIRGYDNSTAQEYADNFGRTFISLGSFIKYGDCNNDGYVNIADAVMLQKYLLGSGSLTNWKNADLCKDDRIDVFDMVLMRKLLIENN